MNSPALLTHPMHAAARSADPDWTRAVRDAVLDLKPGKTFMVEDLLDAVAVAGYSTRDQRAVGSIINTLSREGRIVRTGKYRPARTSNGSLRAEWRRRGTKR